MLVELAATNLAGFRDRFRSMYISTGIKRKLGGRFGLNGKFNDHLSNTISSLPTVEDTTLGTGEDI